MTDSVRPEPLTRDALLTNILIGNVEKEQSIALNVESVRAAFEYALNVMQFYEKNSVDPTATAGVQLCIDALKSAFPVFKEVQPHD